MTRIVRYGVLGAARIAPAALIRPAREVPEAEAFAVAARDPARAAAFARKHGVARVHESYEALLADPDVDAVYNPLPNNLHYEWTVRALEAGKHVLCEKPLSSNADEARKMAEAAGRTGRLLVEAFHYRFHPMAARLVEIVRSGALGRIRRIETEMSFPLPFFSDIRYQYELAGGALMDAGCYAVNLLRLLAGQEPEVVSARAKLARPKVDRYMEAEFRFPDGTTGGIVTALLSARLVRLRARVLGDRGELRVANPFAPQLYHRIEIRTPEGRTVEKSSREATYTFQLREFTRRVLAGETRSDLSDSIANMEAIDAVYEKAGLGRRGT